MKKVLLFTWYILSFTLLTFGIFLFQDEIISKKDILFIALILISASAVSYLSLRISSERSLKFAFLLAGFLSFAACFLTEAHKPVFTFLPDNPHITIKAEESPITLNWAYWAETPTNLNTNIYDWKAWKDISFERMNFSSNWERNGNSLLCSGDCEITFPDGIHFHQPMLSFQSDTHVVVYSGFHPYDVHPNIVTPVYVSGKELSRQLIFTVFCTALGGVLCCFLSFPAILFATFRKSTQNTDSNTGNKSNLSKEPTQQNQLHKSNQRSLGWLIYPASFLLPIAILFLITYLLDICPFGENTFLISDMQCQYVDFLVHLRTLLREGRNLFYSFSKSIGDDYLSLFAYYLANPLDWIIALFPESHIPKAVSLVILLRYAICGLTAAVYFRQVHKTKGETLIFSTAYALMSLNFVIAEHTQLRNGVLILPLVFLGIDRIIQQKGGLVYYLSLAAAILLNYYSGFQICCFAVLYFIYRLFIINRGHKLLTSFRFVFLSLLSAGSCAVLLIPVVLQLGGGMKTFDISIFTLKPNFEIGELVGKLFNSAFDQSQTLTSGSPNIFAGVMVPFCLPLYFMNRRIQKREKILTGLLLLVCFLTMWINALNLIVHGFNEPVWWPYRYSFAVSLILLLPVLSCFKNSEGTRPVQIFLCALISTAILFFLKKQAFTWFNESAVFLNILLIVIIAGLFFLTEGSFESRWAMLFFICLDLFLNGWMILADKTAYERAETGRSFVEYYEENKALIEEIKNKDRDFYRIEKTYSRDANDAFLLDYSGVSHFSSTLKYKIMQFLPAAGYRFYPTRFEYGEGSTVTMDSLLGLKYIVSNKKTIGKPYTVVFTRGDKTVYRNPYCLPIAFMTDSQSELQEDILSISDHFMMQNVIFEALSGNPDPIFTEALIEHESTKDNEAEWKIKCQNTGTLYAVFDSPEENLVSIEVNGKFIDNYFDGKGHPLLRLGSFAEGEEIHVIMKTTDTSGSLNLSEAVFAFENPFLLLSEINQLKEHALTINAYSDTEINGSITAETEGKLFFSIPFDKGWSLTIDGVKTESVHAFGIFLTADVPAGEHQIQLRYRPQGFIPGVIISIVSIICTAGGLIAERKYLSQIAEKKL